MKKINYFGKEYTVSDNMEWVATCLSGNVITFTEKPWIILDAWAASGGSSRIDVCGVATKDWKNSLRKVEDIIVSEDTPAPSGHPHADLMLKYAMIAQYDDKPWEYFEFETSIGWNTCSTMVAFNENVNYRLKPQMPVAQAGQIWIDSNGVEVTVTNSPVGIVSVNLALGGENIIWTFLIDNFLKNFKRKN